MADEWTEQNSSFIDLKGQIEIMSFLIHFKILAKSVKIYICGLPFLLPQMYMWSSWQSL